MRFPPLLKSELLKAAVVVTALDGITKRITFQYSTKVIKDKKKIKAKKI